jgi:hypothetical protein
MTGTHAEQQKKPTTQRQSTRPAPAPSMVAPQRGPVSMRQLIQRALDDPSSLTAVDGAHLQRSIGNRAVGQILAASAAAKRAANPGAPAIQTKLTLGPAHDKYEQEADRTAKQVMRSLDAPAEQADAAPDETLAAKPFDTSLAALQANGMARVAREYSASLAQRRQSGKGTLQAKPLADGISRIQREELTDEDELQAKPLHGLGGGEVDPGVAATIGSAKGGGRPLHDGVRASMERGFGADFSGVRVHTGGQADALNRSLNARAFTTGSDIFFGKGQYNPGSRGGQELIAHELTHTVQQGGGAQGQPAVQRFSDADVQPGATTDWNAETVRVTKSETGMISGVFFPQDQGGKKLVIKPEYRDNTDRPTTSAQTQFADKALTQMGFNLPASRIIYPSDNEFGQIVDVISSDNPQRLYQRSGDPFALDALGQIRARLAGAKYLKVMTAVDGKAWSDVLKGVRSQEKADEFFTLISGNGFALVRNMAKMVVADALIGNDDRAMFKTGGFGKGFNGNTDNWMISGNDLVLIDSDSSIGDLNKIGTQQGGLQTAKKGMAEDMLNDIFDKREEYARTFAAGHLRNTFEDNLRTTDFDLLGYFDQWHAQHAQEIIAAFLSGLDDGMAQVRQLFGDKEQLQGLKNEINTYGEGEEGNLWSTFKSRGKYLLSRGEGVGKNEAQLQSRVYQEYKFTGGEGLPLDNLGQELDETVVDIHIPKSLKKSGKKPKSQSKKQGAKPMDERISKSLESGTWARTLDHLIDRQNRIIPAQMELLGNSITTLHEEAQKLKGSRAKYLLLLGSCMRLIPEFHKKQGEIKETLNNATSLALSLRDEKTSPKMRDFAVRRRDRLVNSGLNERLARQVARLAATAHDVKGPLRTKNPLLAQRIDRLADTLQTQQQILADQMAELARLPATPWGQVQKPMRIGKSEVGGLRIGNRPRRQSQQ